MKSDLNEKYKGILGLIKHKLIRNNTTKTTKIKSWNLDGFSKLKFLRDTGYKTGPTLRTFLLYTLSLLHRSRIGISGGATV